MSNHQTTTHLSQFTVTRFDQTATPVHKIKIHHKVQSSSDPGLFEGVELLDSGNNTIAKAGDWGSDIFSKVTDIDLSPGERIIGFKCGRRDRTIACNYDVQFVLSKQV